jgi:hypothetical protein
MDQPMDPIANLKEHGPTERNTTTMKTLFEVIVRIKAPDDMPVAAARWGELADAIDQLACDHVTALNAGQPRKFGDPDWIIEVQAVADSTTERTD